MYMRIRILKVNSQAGNIRVYIMTIQKAKATRYSA